MKEEKWISSIMLDVRLTIKRNQVQARIDVLLAKQISSQIPEHNLTPTEQAELVALYSLRDYIMYLETWVKKNSFTEAEVYKFIKEGETNGTEI